VAPADDPADGRVLVRDGILSVDPMRGGMNDVSTFPRSR
jgi:NADPH-dependent curcumin reductase CurA